MLVLIVSGIMFFGEVFIFMVSFIVKEVQKMMVDIKGDWCFFVFLMMDGSLNDDWCKGLNDFKVVRIGVVVVCVVGYDVDISVFKEIIEIVVQFDIVDSLMIKVFFKWVSVSILVGSQKVEFSKKEVIGFEDLLLLLLEVNVVL